MEEELEIEEAKSPSLVLEEYLEINFKKSFFEAVSMDELLVS